MKTTIVTACAAWFLGLGFSSVAEAGKKDAKHSAASAEMMQAWMKASTPGAPHKALKSLAGSWRVKSTMWMAPDASPQRSSGKSKVQMVFGNRFAKQTYRGTFMGKPFRGEGMTGYDNIKGKYVSTWADSMSTTMMTAEGTADESGKVITYTTTYSCPKTGGTKQAKMITRVQGKNKYVMEMYDRDANGKEFKSLELVYTRGG